MTERDNHDHDDKKPRHERSGEPSKSAALAKSELFAALGHLKNAAEILVGAADPAVRKAASEAERMLQKVGAEAEPVAQKLGAELGKMTRAIVGAIEGKGRGEPPAKERADKSEIERLEREAEGGDEKKR